MRGRIASFAIGSAVATRRTEARMSQQAQTQQAQAQAPQAQQSASAAQPPQEDITQKLQKLADLHKQGILSDEEFQKMKADLIAKL
ncbi:MAG: SHOCT domain-containing protein [Nitrososphaeraceae archaeon]|jgi:membrane protease subunit (stomatin/prohibitin family)